MNTRRTSPEILRDILTAGPGSESSIRFATGMNHVRARWYLRFLLSNGLLQPRPDNGRTATYIITAKGEELLRCLDELFELLSDGVPE